MSLPWSPQQREWMQALGHGLLVLAQEGSIGDTTADSPPGAGADSPPAPARARDVRSEEPRSRQASQDPASALHRALLKATRLSEPEAEQALRALGVDASALRADPGAKRSLWQKLRGLRRGTAG